HYSSDGLCYLAVPAARISPKQQITHSFNMPDRQQGITRIIYWENSPGQDLLESLALSDNEERSISGLLYQAWYPRTGRHESGLPFEAQQFRVYEQPP